MECSAASCLAQRRQQAAALQDPFHNVSRRIRARQQSVSSLSSADLGLETDQLAAKGYRILDVRPPERTHQVELLQGSALDIADALLNKIQESR